jgi:hypothetical protein
LEPSEFLTLSYGDDVGKKAGRNSRNRRRHTTRCADEAQDCRTRDHKWTVKAVALNLLRDREYELIPIRCPGKTDGI